MIDRRQLKTDAREAMRQTKPSAVWVTLAVVAFLIVIQVLSMFLNGSMDAYKQMYESYMAGSVEYIEPVGTTSLFGWLLTVALDVMSMVLAVGYTLYTLRISRRMNPGFGDVFDAFGVFFRAVWVSVLRTFMISIATFIFVVPFTYVWFYVSPEASLLCLPLLAFTVIVAYSYHLAVFLMLDNPHMTGMQCLAVSRFLMRGQKWKLFKIDLSFIGWFVLSIIPFVGLWVMPYLNVVYAGFYDVVKSNLDLVMKQEVNPQSPEYHTPWQTNDTGSPDDKDSDSDDES